MRHICSLMLSLLCIHCLIPSILGHAPTSEVPQCNTSAVLATGEINERWTRKSVDTVSLKQYDIM